MQRPTAVLGWLLGGLFVVTLFVILAPGLLQTVDNTPRRYADPAASGGAMSGQFTLQASDGRQVTEVDFHGRWQLIFFGYTSCPDICPTTLLTVGAALELLGDDAARVQPLFISVDPGRDTPRHLADYLTHFHPAILGLSGDNTALSRAAQGFGVYYRKVPQAGGSYLVDHTPGLFLFGPDGIFEALLRDSGDPRQLAQSIGDYL